MAFWSGLFGKRDSDRDLRQPPVTLANLRLQVFSERYFGMQVIDRAGSAIRPLAPGLLEVIVEDTGAGERTMRWEYLRAFGKSDEDMFALARAQAAAIDNQIASEVLDGIQVMISNHFYLSAHVLANAANTRLGKGSFVAPISWHHWCAHPIQHMTVVPHIQMMRFLAQSIAQQMNVTDAERLTTDVYWLKPTGQLDRIEMDKDEPVLSRELARTLEDR